MAGAGFKTFNTGDVLTASDVNTYLMQQTIMVFNDAAARTTALSGVLAEGMLSYLKDTNAVEKYDGSTWAAIVAGDIEGVTAGVGISGGGTSGTVTITNSMATAIDAKGDLVAGTGADTFARLAVGIDGTFLSADSGEATGLKWVASPNPASWNIVQQTARSTDDELLVAKYLNGYWIVGDDDGGGAYSTDGTTWTANTIGSDEIRGLTFGNSTYVAGLAGGTIRTSTNLTSWTTRTSNILAGENINDVIWDGAKFICVAGETTTSGNKISTSTDGTTWTARLTTTRRYFSVANNGTSNYVAVGISGADGAYATSTNGTSWTEAAVLTNDPLYKAVWDGTDFIIVGQDGINLRIYRLTTAGVLTTITYLPVGGSATVTDFHYDGTNFFIGLTGTTYDENTILKGGFSHCYQKVNSGILSYNANTFAMASNNGQYLGAAGDGTIMFGTEPRVL